MDREQAWSVFRKYNNAPSLCRHALAVEGTMRYFAGKAGEDADLWGMVGLLHDIDYEKWPEEHCKKAESLLAEEGFDPAFVRAVISHGYGICTDVEPESLMEKTLFAIDELTGLIAAAALMLPTKSVEDLKLSSLKKKWKDKRFAAGVNRDIVLQGCEMLGVELEALMQDTIDGMKQARPFEE